MAGHFLDALTIPYELNVPLKDLTWYRVGGPAACLARPQSSAQLAALVHLCREKNCPVYVLGSGANLLVADAGVAGVVVRLDAPAFSELSIKGNLAQVGAGYDLAKLVLALAHAGLGGLECMAGIPASVGGAVRMNAGGAFGDIGRCVRTVTVMGNDGTCYQRNRDDLVFAYRKTNIVAPFILEVELELTPQDPDELMKRVKEIFLYKKNTQPLAADSAGCAFKNPTTVPAGAPASAGALIDRAGLKGQRIGAAEVSEKHANFIVAHPGCSAGDILALIQHIQQTVQQRFGVALEREIVVWP